MDKTQWYIGAPNGVVVCIDNVENYRTSGRIYNAYSWDPQWFSSYDDMVNKMDDFFNEINFPAEATTIRTFIDEKNKNTTKPIRKEKIMSDKDMLNMHGDLGSFVIRVQQKQNSSWQGRITWLEEDKTVCFRSIWEMLKLMESAVGKTAPEAELPKDKEWD